MSSIVRLMNVCSECGSDDLLIDEKAGEVACRQCGLVLNNTVMDMSPEWSAFTREEINTRRRAGPPVSLSKYDKGLSTKIPVTKDSHGRILSTSERYKMMRLRKWNYRSQLRSSKMINLSKAMNELDRLCDILSFPKIVKESAALIYRKALGKGLLAGRSITAITAASLYLAVRRANLPRTLKEICEVSGKGEKEISRNYRLLIWELDYKTPIDDPVRYVSKIALKAGISQKVQMRAIEILHRAKHMDLHVGKRPRGLAASALYIACLELGNNTLQKRIAKAAGVSTVTIRNRYKELMRDLKLKPLEVKI